MRYLQARETTVRIDNAQFQYFVQLKNDLTNSFSSLQGVFNKGIFNGLNTQRNGLSSIHNTIKEVSSIRKHLLQWQEFHLEKNFVSYKDDVEVKIMFYLTFGCQEFSYQIGSRIKQMTSDSLNITMTSDIRNALFAELLQMINGRLDLADKAYESYQKILNAYRNGEPIDTFEYEEEPFEHSTFIIPRTLLNYSISINDMAANDSVSFGEEIEYLKILLLEYVSQAKTSFYDNTVNDEAIDETSAQFLSWCARFNQTKWTFYSDVVEYPLTATRQKLIDFDQELKDFENTFQLMSDRVELLLANLGFQRNVMSEVEQSIGKAEWYVSFNNVTRLQVAEAFTSEHMQKGIKEIMTFVTEIRSGSQSIYDGWSSLIQSFNAICDTIIEDDNLQDYYKFNNMTDFLTPCSETAGPPGRQYNRLREASNLQIFLSNLDSVLMKNLDRMVAEMKIFIDGSVVDAEFVKDNFLRLDIFYKGKGYDQITQQATYNVVALFCDIGATMALFLGASTLTLCELVDLGLHHFIYRLTHSDRIQ